MDRNRKMSEASYGRAMWAAMALLFIFLPGSLAAAAPERIGHVHTLIVLPENPTLFMGTHKGLLMSHDKGQTWEPVPLPRKFQGTDVMSLVADPGDRRRLYAGTHDWGVLRSLDGGKTWEDVNVGLGGRDVHALTIDPTSQDASCLGGRQGALPDEERRRDMGAGGRRPRESRGEGTGLGEHPHRDGRYLPLCGYGYRSLLESGLLLRLEAGGRSARRQDGLRRGLAPPEGPGDLRSTSGGDLLASA